MKQCLQQNNLFVKLWLLLFIPVCFSSCGSPVNTDPAYGIMVFDSVQDIDSFIPAVSLKVGEPKAKGMNLPAGATVIATYGQDYFIMHTDTKTFAKYRATQQGFVKEKELNLKDIPFETYASWVIWGNPHTILLGSVVNEQFNYVEFDLSAVKVLRHGQLQIPPAPAGKNYSGIAAQFAGNKLYIFYTYQKDLRKQHIYPPDGAVYGAVFNYPELQLLNKLKDTRTTWPGSYNIWGPNTLVLDNYIYVLGQPGGRTADHPTAPSGILRVNSKTETFDPGYFFQLGDRKTEEAYTLHDLGHGLAMTKIIEKQRVHRFYDYLHKRTAHYELLDLKKQTRTRLKTENIILAFWKDILVEGDLAYVAVYLGGNTSQIWIYNLKTGSLTAGAKVNGRVFRMERLAGPVSN